VSAANTTSSGRAAVQQQAAEVWREVKLNVPAVATLLRRVSTDDRVPTSAKVQVGAALAYLVSPLNVAANAIPLVGQLDDAAVIAFVVRRVLSATGEPLLRELWTGSDKGFAALMKLAQVFSSPTGWGRRVALAGSAAGFARSAWRGRGSNGRVINGEVVPPRG
jgi:uncharacterized membrane protein YkvA (DUF1232 family)